MGWRRNKQAQIPEQYNTIIDGLKRIYKEKLLPLEQQSHYHSFYSPPLEDADFEAKPMVLLVGQYSTGKTTFIKYLLDDDFPGIRIGPEPTTDNFIAIMHGRDRCEVPGNSLVADRTKQFQHLSRFGSAFLNRFRSSQLNNQVLETVTFIDTPGILSGEKQSLARGYDFTAILTWFAERVDRILLLFDAHKLDISDEFSDVIKAMRPFDEKIRIVLNKADMVDSQDLMRVYGSLMWFLGKLIDTPEVSRVYIGSFWSQKLHFDTNRKLFELESEDLFQDLQSLPRTCTLRKLNDLCKRAHNVKAHAAVMDAYYQRCCKGLFGKEGKKKDAIKEISLMYRQIEQKYSWVINNLPDKKFMQEQLEAFNFKLLTSLDDRLLQRVDTMTGDDVSRLMQMVPHESHEDRNKVVMGGAFNNYIENKENGPTPFERGRGEGFDIGRDEDEWIVSKDRDDYDRIFVDLNPQSGRLTGAAAKSHMVKSRLPNPVLAKVWKLSDIDKDGMLDLDEWALANYLIKVTLQGHDLPADLPVHLIPPSKRR